MRSERDAIPYDVREGGLFRCCLASLHEAMARAEQLPRNGDVLTCDICSEQMVYRLGAWEWEGVAALPAVRKRLK